jgi:hypothetical protein
VKIWRAALLNRRSDDKNFGAVRNHETRIPEPDGNPARQKGVSKPLGKRLVEAPRKNLAAAFRRAYEDIAAQQRWFFYAKAAGMFLPNFEEDNFYTAEQERFFAEYDAQMEEG